MYSHLMVETKAILSYRATSYTKNFDSSQRVLFTGSNPKTQTETPSLTIRGREVTLQIQRQFGELCIS